MIQPENGAYRVAFANKFGVRPYGPALPNPPSFDGNSQFSEYLLTKCMTTSVRNFAEFPVINGEKAAMNAPDFRQRFSKTRETLLKNILEIFGGKKRNIISSFVGGKKDKNNHRHRIPMSPLNTSSRREDDDSSEESGNDSQNHSPAKSPIAPKSPDREREDD